MKRNCLSLASALALILSMMACQNDITDNQQLDPNATINIYPASSINGHLNSKLRSSNAYTHLTALEIVKGTEGMSFQYESITYERGFSSAQRDTITPCLKMWGSDIIDQDGNYHARFIESTDCVLIRLHNVNQPSEWKDTIAYIPNSILRSAEARIKAAYTIKDYNTCYQVFDSAFVFIPITGEEWRTLKADSLQ